MAAREGVASVGAVVRGTVLLVEHEGPVRAYLEQQLADDGFEVLAVERDVQALDLAEEVKPDLVLLGAVLPDASGSSSAAACATKSLGAAGTATSPSSW